MRRATDQSFSINSFIGLFVACRISDAFHLTDELGRINVTTVFKYPEKYSGSPKDGTTIGPNKVTYLLQLAFSTGPHHLHERHFSFIFSFLLVILCFGVWFFFGGGLVFDPPPTPYSMQRCALLVVFRHQRQP